MKVVSFNVNSIRTRLHQLAAVVEKHSPDVIGLQETKVVDDDFPVETIAELGYNVTFHGQKSHYGVALLAKAAPENTLKGFPHDDDQAQRRFISATVDTPTMGSVCVINGYFPQGESREHPVKFPGKEKFYRDLHDHLQQHHHRDAGLIVMGDMNVAPRDTDIGIGEDNRKRWLKAGKCSFLPEEREWLTRIQNWGLHDTYRHLYPDVDDRFSWFDYRSRGFERKPKRGLRIDLILATAPLAQRCVDAGIDYDIRGMERPSDHCPVWAEFE